MNSTVPCLVIQAVTAIATVALVLVAWLQIGSLKQQVKLAGDQARTTFEDRLTGHYRRIMEDIPIEVWLNKELKEDDPRRNRCRDAIYRYIDLSQDQVFLYMSKRITEKTWTEWSKGIKSNMKLKAFQEVWAEVSEKHPDNFNELRRLVG